jgi:hypothetical protein
MIPAGIFLQALIAGAALESGAALQPCLQEDGAAPAKGEAPAVEPAQPDVLERLLDEHAAAEGAKDATLVQAALEKMRPYDNPELAKPALDALRYKGSSVDRKAAKAELDELGLTDRDAVEQRVLLRESQVRAAGARVLANQPLEVGAKALGKALADKQNQKERPLAVASIIDALGRLGDRGVEGEVEDLYQDYSDEAVVRAAVLYFGRVKTKDLGIVLLLCAELSAPVPESVDSAANPPADYWERRWKMWMAVRRDVSWALKEITGQVFAPAEGEHKGDAPKARDWVKANARELGLR